MTGGDGAIGSQHSPSAGPRLPLLESEYYKYSSRDDRQSFTKLGTKFVDAVHTNPSRSVWARRLNQVLAHRNSHVP